MVWHENYGRYSHHKQWKLGGGLRLFLQLPACAVLRCQRSLPGHTPARDSMTWLKKPIMVVSVLGAQLQVEELGYLRRRKAELLSHAKLKLVVMGQISCPAPSWSGKIADAEGKR